MVSLMHIGFTLHRGLAQACLGTATKGQAVQVWALLSTWSASGDRGYHIYKGQPWLLVMLWNAEHYSDAMVAVTACCDAAAVSSSAASGDRGYHIYKGQPWLLVMLCIPELSSSAGAVYRRGFCYLLSSLLFRQSTFEACAWGWGPTMFTLEN